MSYTRRQFLKSSVSAAGGLLVSFHIPVSGKEVPFESYATETPEINAWLLIEPDDTITIRVAQSEMGQGVLTALPMIVAEELEADFSKVRAEYADVNRNVRENGVYRRMRTGGSGAVRRSRKYLQQAGANARQQLIEAAARRWLVDAGSCRADYGRIYHDASNRSINYGAIAGAAAGIEVGNVRIKTPEEFGLLGLPQKRLDVPAKVNGSAIFGMDVRVPEMVYAAVVHCPVIGGALRSLRFNAVRNRPGVQRAIRLSNAVAIIADTYWHAKTAVEAMPVDWQIGPAGQSFSTNWEDEYIEALKEEGVLVEETGDTKKALDTSEYLLKVDYRLPYLSQACMEPINCTVHVQDDRVDVWVGSQVPDQVLQVAAELTGVAPENVFVHNCYLGGGFGRRSDTDFVREAVEIAKQVDKPVQMIWSREEDMRGGKYRPMSAQRFRAGFDIDKNITVLTNHSVVHSRYLDRDPDSVRDGIDRSSLAGLLTMPYEIKHKRITHTIRNTHLTSWNWRSAGHSQNAFAVECFMDEMAETAEKDPIVFRKSLLTKRPDLVHILEVLRRKSGWGRSMASGVARGVAIHESFGTIVGQVAEVSINQGRAMVHKVISVVDCGNLVNPLTAEEQVESCIVFGLSAALSGKITVENGRVIQGNFDRYPVVRMKDMPVIETHFELSGGDKWGGMGESALPPLAPAICNALYRLTKRRVRSLPLHDYYLTTRSAS